jgi:hypothetical protein
MNGEDVSSIEAFEMWIWRRMEKMKWTDKVANAEDKRRKKPDRNRKEKSETLDRTNTKI